MSIARWTPLSAVDREAAKTRREVARATRLFRFAVFVGVVAMFAPSVLGEIYPVGSALSLGVAMVSFVAARRAFVWRGRTEAQVWRRDANLIDEFRSDRSWLVEILVLRGSAPNGADRGMLWIEDERLYFVGERTSFGLTVDQVSGYCRFSTPLPGLRHDLTFPLRGGASLSLSPVVPAKWQDKATVNEIGEAVDDWSRRSEAKGGQLPPLALGEDAPSESALLLGAIIASAYWLAISLVTLAFFFSLFLSFCFVPFIVGGIVARSCAKAVCLPGLRWLAWRDRRRLEKAQWKT